jgi:small subunit ribosomal protein S21
MSGDEAGDPTATQGEQKPVEPTPEPAKTEPEVRAAAHEPAPATPVKKAEGVETPASDDRRRPRRRSDNAGEAVLCRPLEVVVRDDKVDQAIRQLKNRLAREGILRELKNRRHYFKPSELKRIKRREAARRRRKQARQRARK